MRRRAKADSNQPEIVAALRKRGATVQHTHQIPGALDLIVGYRGVDVRVEIKDSSKPPSARKLTPSELEVFDTWRGRHPEIVTSVDDAMDLLDYLYMEAAR